MTEEQIEILFDILEYLSALNDSQAISLYKKLYNEILKNAN